MKSDEEEKRRKVATKTKNVAFCGLCFLRGRAIRPKASQKTLGNGEFHNTTALRTLAAASALMIAGFANAAPIIQSSFDNNGQALAPTDDGMGNFSYTFSSLGSFEAVGTGKLVLGYTSRDNADSQGGPPTTVSYGGVDLVLAGRVSGGRSTTGMWFLDNVPTDGDLVINFGTDGGTTDVGFSLFALDGLVSGNFTDGESVASSTSPTVTLESHLVTCTSSARIFLADVRSEPEPRTSGTG